MPAFVSTITVFIPGMAVAGKVRLTEKVPSSLMITSGWGGEPPPAVPERVMHPKSLLPVRRRRDDVSKVTDQVLMKAMALQTDQRFDSVAEMYEALFGLRRRRRR